MAAAVGTARVTFPMVVVMITPDIGVEVQATVAGPYHSHNNVGSEPHL